MFDLQKSLDQRRADGLYRRRRRVLDANGPRLQLAEGERLAFCSNDYLGLADHPDIAAAFTRGVERWGTGAGAAHLVSGHSAAHQALEEELAAFTGRERALLFSTGYMANLGAINALLGRGDTLLEDRLNHASLIDGGLLCPARMRRYPHADVEAVERLLPDATQRCLLATDGVFSMDGDTAPLPELARACAEHGAWLMVDDAHGIGVLGRGGRGSVDHYGLSAEQVPLLMGTLGKGFGTFGAFVAGSEALIETLIQQARPYVYTTATPPALAEATRAALRIVERADDRRDKLRVLIARFRAGAKQLGLPLMDSQTPIQPIVAGSAERALDWAARLEQQGLLVTPIRPPTVPEGGARLRVTLSAAHSEADVDRLLGALQGMVG